MLHHLHRRLPHRARVTLAAMTIAAGVVIALTGNPMSGSTILACTLVTLGGWWLVELAAPTQAAITAEINRSAAAESAANDRYLREHRRALDARRAAANATARAGTAEAAAHRADATAAALIAYASGAPADDAMRTFRTA